MEVRRRAAVPRDGQLHQQNFEAHPQGHRHAGDRTRSRRAGSCLRSSALALAFLLTTNAFAFTARLVDSDGKPVAGAQISVVQQSGSARTDADGNFTFVPDPTLPATLIIVGSRGEIFPPIYLTSLVSELRTEPAYR